MKSFDYQRASTIDDALHGAARPHTKYIAGGTNLIDLMKAGIEAPDALIDLSRLKLDVVENVPNGGVRIGATARNSDVANHALIRDRYPLLSQALVAGASPQLRNMATVGGNLMQRTRCHYFYDVGFDRCNKRQPGSGCGAIQGRNRMHAILGASSACVAVNPSDMNVALRALDAVVIVRDAQGMRHIPIGEFHRLPGNHPETDTTLSDGALILGLELPPPVAGMRSHYLKIRDRASYAFAIVSVAAAVALHGETVVDARIALGGVAHKPWRVRAAEEALIGKSINQTTVRKAADILLKDAHALAENQFKIPLARSAIERAMFAAAGVA
jgi:xanthine dehydrogenase YagS FAD-binding subunit